jgi:membrane protein required for colicin V production
MQVIDIVFLCLAGLLILRCFLKGFTGEIISLASFALGIIGAVFFFKAGANFIRTMILSGVAILPEILAFLAIFLIVFIAGKIIDHIVKDIINRLHLDGLNRILGLVLGLLEAIALISIILLLICIQPLFNPEPLLAQSLFARLLLPLIGLAREWVYV